MIGSHGLQGNRRVKKFLTVIREILEGSMGQPYVGLDYPNIRILDNDTFYRDNTFGLVILLMPPLQSMSEGPSL